MQVPFELKAFLQQQQHHLLGTQHEAGKPQLIHSWNQIQKVESFVNPVAQMRNGALGLWSQ